jgi:uroporphyrinogen decarboxylase
MTQLEIFHATVNHQPHDEFLFYADFTSDLDRRLREKYALMSDVDLREPFGMYRPEGIQPKEPKGLPKPDYSVYFEDVDKPEGSFINGLGVLEIPAKLYHFTGYVSPLRKAKSLQDLERFPFPGQGILEEADMADRVKQAHRQGKVALTGVGHMYEDSWQVRGYEEFLMDLADKPEWCEFILDRFTRRNLQIAAAAARAGVDYIITGDDVASQKNMMFSAQTWRRLMKVRWAKVCAEARRIKPDIQIWYHSDGNIMEIIPDLIEIGVTILNPVQPECLNPQEVKKQYGKHLVLDGTIGTQSTMPFSGSEEVKRVVRERKETLGFDGGLILSPTHILEPEVPLENIAAFVDACREK